MKKLQIIPVLVLVSLFLSCNEAEEHSGMSAAAQKNLAAFEGVGKSFETKDFSKLGDYIAEDAVDHAGPQGDIKGLANIKSMFEEWSKQTENEKNETKVVLANDDYVMGWMQFSGKAKVDMPDMGQKAGDTYDMQAIEVAKFKDGKMTEHWTFMNPADMMKMMGGAQGQMPMPMDTTKAMQ